MGVRYSKIGMPPFLSCNPDMVHFLQVPSQYYAQSVLLQVTWIIFMIAMLGAYYKVTGRLGVRFGSSFTVRPSG